MDNGLNTKIGLQKFYTFNYWNTEPIPFSETNIPSAPQGIPVINGSQIQLTAHKFPTLLKIQSQTNPVQEHHVTSRKA